MNVKLSTKSQQTAYRQKVLVSFPRLRLFHMIIYTVFAIEHFRKTSPNSNKINKWGHQSVFSSLQILKKTILFKNRHILFIKLAFTI